MNKIIDATSYKNLNKETCLVMMSTFKGGAFIKQQIDSIMNQEAVNVYLLIRDDGSTDNTIQIIKSAINTYGDKIQAEYGTNVGIHKSFAKLIEKAGRYDYYAFADQDDVWDLDKLAIAISSLKENESDFYSCAARLVNESLESLNATTSDASRYNHYMMGNSKILTPGSQGCTMVLTNKLFEIIRTTNYPNYYGHDTWITIVAYCLNNSLYDSKEHLSYRQHNKSWTGNRSQKIKQFIRELKFFITGLKRYKTISLDILERYEKTFNKDEIEIAKLIAHYDNNLIQRITGKMKYKFKKDKFATDIIFTLYYLFR